MKIFKNIFLNTTIAVVTTFVILIQAEIFIRVFYPQPLVKTGNYDSTLGWTNVASSSNLMLHKDYKVMVNINSKGLRDKEYAYEKSKDISRILVLGDSFAWGAGVEDNETFSNVLGDMLGEKFEVLNAGVNGYGNDQELLYLMTEGYKYSPDIVLLVFCFNDIENNMLNFDRGGIASKPRFILENNSLKLTNVPVPEPRQGNNNSVFLLKDYLKNNSHIYALTRTVKKNFKYRYARQPDLVTERSEEHIQKLRNNRDLWGFTNQDETIYFPLLKKWPDTALNGWTLTKNIILEIKNYSEKIGAEFVVTLVPYSFEIYEKDWQRSVEKYKLNSESYDLLKAQKMFNIFELENNLNYISLTDSFKKYKKQRLYFEHDGHWNKYGHQLAAEVIYNHLIEYY